jgi:phosphatidate cytidylyltransferase
MATDDEREDGLEHTGYRSGRVRIVGAEPAGRSAAIDPTDDAAVWNDDPDDAAAEEHSAAPFVTPPLPHWTEPATGEVPSILSREPESKDSDPFASLPGPTWREEGSDWEAQGEEFEPSMLAGDQTGQGSLDSGPSDRQPWVFDLPGSKAASQIFGQDETGWEEGENDWDDLARAVPPPAWVGEVEDQDPITAVIPKVSGALDDEGIVADTVLSSTVLEELDEELSEPEPPRRVVRPDAPIVIDDDADLADAIDEPRLRFRSQRSENRRTAAAERKLAPPPRRPVPTPSGRPGSPVEPPAAEAPPRNVAAAIVSGVVLGAVALVSFKIGSAAAVALVTVVVTMAAAEAYAAFRQGGYHPVTLLGLVATVSLMIAAYNKGEAALPLVIVLLLVFCFIWHLAGVEHTDAVRSTGTTLFVFGWVAVFGSFGALLLSPALFPDRHGIAFLLGGLIAGVAYDVGALTFGAWLGRHPMASVSPNKTWEGFVGGLLTSVVFSVVIVHMIHPWTVGKAATLGLVVSVVTTLGDLFESTVKRHLGRKDMGRLLPGHGGLLDRVDGLLFVLPATFYLVIAFHLG